MLIEMNENEYRVLKKVLQSINEDTDNYEREEYEEGIARAVKTGSDKRNKTLFNLFPDGRSKQSRFKKKWEEEHGGYTPDSYVGRHTDNKDTLKYKVMMAKYRGIVRELENDSNFIVVKEDNRSVNFTYDGDEFRLSADKTGFGKVEIDIYKLDTNQTDFQAVESFADVKEYVLSH